MQIGMAGMAPYFGERIFSGHDLPRSKPHPDVYLAAAAHLGVHPSRCLVVEDTATGAEKLNARAAFTAVPSAFPSTSTPIKP